MQEINTEKYYSMLKSVEDNLQEITNETANELLDDLFHIKPVRLKWFLIKALVMHREGKPPSEIIEFLSDKCTPLYIYDDVEDYLKLLSVFSQLKGDRLDSERYLYQLKCLLMEEDIETDVQLRRTVDELLLNEQMNIDDIKRLMELYYISGNWYLYLLWKEVLYREGVEVDTINRDWIFEKFNSSYYAERLSDENNVCFVLMSASREDEPNCMLSAKALKRLGKRVFVLKNPICLDEKELDKKWIIKSIESMRKTEGIHLADTFYVETERGIKDTRSKLLHYISAHYTEDDFLMIMGSGFLLDQMALEKENKPRLERLTMSDGDYMENNMAVGRYGNYLSYIANIYKTTREKMEAELYKKPTCRFSIIIPCRNDGDTLYYTLKTCLNQSFKGQYEIVISDNADASLGSNTSAFEICKKLDDDKIKYYRAPRNLSLMKNFEFGYLKAEGEFLISMGADDGILPWALEELNVVLNQYPEKKILLWDEIFYKWADVDDRVMAGTGSAVLSMEALYVKNSPDIFCYDPKKILKKSLSQFGMMYFLPQIYHNSGIRREYLASLYERTGVLWAGISQDLCMAVTIAELEQELTFINNPFTITGISNASIGAKSRVGNSNLKQENLVKKMRNTFGQGWRAPGYMERLFPLVGSQIGGLYACVLYANAIGVIPDEMIDEFDWKEMYGTCVKELAAWDVLYDVKIHKIKYAIAAHGPELLEWFENELVGELLSPRSFIIDNASTNDTKYQEYIQIQKKYVEAEPYSISDVYKVSLFIERVMKDMTNEDNI